MSNTAKVMIAPNIVPFFNSSVPYVFKHGNIYLTPAHIMQCVLNDYKVRRKLKEVFSITSDDLFEISRGLFLYCENMRIEYLTSEELLGFSFSLEYLDFVDNYNRDFHMNSQLQLSSFFLALDKSSPELCTIFESVFDMDMNYIIKTLKSAENQNESVFDMTADEYLRYAEWSINLHSNKDALLAIMNKNSDVLDEQSKRLYQNALVHFDAVGVLNALIGEPGIASAFYDMLQTSIEKKAPCCLENGIPVVLGYEEIYTILKSADKLDELDSMLEELSDLLDSTNFFDTGDIQQVRKSKRSTLEKAEPTESVEPAKAKKEVYMYGNTEPLDLAKDIFVRVDNPYLLVLGDSGTGKTTFVNKLISMANNNEFSDLGLSLYPFKLDIASLNSKSMFKGAFESNFKKVIVDLVRKAERLNKKPLLIIEDIQLTAPSGQTSADIVDTYILMLQMMEEYKFPIVGTCTYDEYRQSIAKKRRYNDKFTVSRIQETDKESTLIILNEVGKELEKQYNQVISESTYKRVYDLAYQFIRDKKFPAKALTLLNQTCAYAYTHKVENVDAGCVEYIMSRDYNVPSARLSTNLLESINSVNTVVKSKVFGQDEAVDKLMKYWKIKQAGLTKKNKPIASLLFVGPTGVGKTELAKQFADAVGYKLVRFDMSEYNEGHSVSKLIGSPSGYVGYDDGGLLVNAIKSNPNCVLLLDEIEKAHPNIYNILLQIMDNAELTGNSGEKVDFQNVVLLMTSNCGARDAEHAKSIGFSQDNDIDNKLKAQIMQEELNRQFTPEFRGRLTGIVQFNNLSESMSKMITDLKFKELNESLSENMDSITFEVDDSLRNYIVSTAMSGTSGGRCIEKMIDEEVKDKLLDVILTNSNAESIKLKLDYSKDTGVNTKIIE